jgi:aminoglycoside phosphotransferase (APT) family kinase protein
MTQLPGISKDNVADWVGQHTEISLPISIHLIEGGHSNLTYRVSDNDGRRFVLRRPPLHSVLATAHDMAREHRIVQGLLPSDVPVPKLVGYCADSSIIGAPFYVMHYVEGIVARNKAAAELIPVAKRETVSKRLIQVLVKLHRLDPVEVGLDTLGRRENYVSRQLRRWLHQVDSLGYRDFPALRRVHSMLAAKIPEQVQSGIVHGDYRLDNCITTPSGDIAAVLDWELCTLGEPRADLGMLLAYWVEPSDVLHPLSDPPTTAKGFATRRQIANWYAEAAETTLEELHLGFFYAFANWRLACILEGVYARYKSAAMGEPPPNVDAFPKTAEALIARAEHALIHADFL